MPSNNYYKSSVADSPSSGLRDKFDIEEMDAEKGETLTDTVARVSRSTNPDLFTGLAIAVCSSTCFFSLRTIESSDLQLFARRERLRSGSLRTRFLRCTDTVLTTWALSNPCSGTPMMEAVIGLEIGRVVREAG